jgi:23S rRNA (adenine2030-N6)-methyltransferase
MLSYRHGFHAGNFADVHKHVALVTLLRAMRRKEKPFTYVDTHAGAGAYALEESSSRVAEWREGIARLREVAAQHPAGLPASVSDYLALVDAAASGGDTAGDAAAATADPLYPGSPSLAQALLREQDRAMLIELHTSEAPRLKARFRGDRRVAVHAPRDAREGLRAVLPPSTPRGLVLIDPSYERVEEYDETARLIGVVRRRWSTAAVAVWYPLLGGPRRNRHRRLFEAVKPLGLPEIARDELCVADPARSGLIGSGLLVIGAPWPYVRDWPAISAWLTQALAAPAG